MKKFHRALNFAIAAHQGQLRKYTGEPYIVHPIEVSMLIATHTDKTSIIIAALLHDVIEDTPFTYANIKFEFGKKIADLVLEVTDVSKPSDGNREERKKIDREHLANASPEAQTIKLADLISNTSFIVKHDKNFAKIYLAEKQLLLTILGNGNDKLHRMACDVLCKARKELANQPI